MATPKCDADGQMGNTHSHMTSKTLHNERLRQEESKNWAVEVTIRACHQLRHEMIRRRLRRLALRDLLLAYRLEYTR